MLTALVRMNLVLPSAVAAARDVRTTPAGHDLAVARRQAGDRGACAIRSAVPVVYPRESGVLWMLMVDYVS